MRIVVIGAGNVATHLAKALAKSNEILQIYSKHLANAQLLAQSINGAVAINDLALIDSSADLYIISVKDDAIAHILEGISVNEGLWVHTSGSVSIDMLANKFDRCGVLYPLQTFSREVDVDIAEVPFFIEGKDYDSNQEIEGIALTLSNSVFHANSDQRKQLHIAAVFGCNFVNHMWAISDEILKNAGYNFDILIPLIKATLNKASMVSPHVGQTGPARRGDVSIMNSHEAMLPTKQAELYHTISNSIMTKYNNHE